MIEFLFGRTIINYHGKLSWVVGGASWTYLTCLLVTGKRIMNDKLLAVFECE
jgi:hypothetical protein